MRYVSWEVSSRGVPGTSHAVRWFLDSGEWNCECQGFVWRETCRHIKLVEEWTLQGLLDMQKHEEDVSADVHH
jgi:hypothetical protein